MADSLREREEAEAKKRKKLAEKKAKQKEAEANAKEEEAKLEAESSAHVHDDLPSDSNDSGGTAESEDAEGDENRSTDEAGAQKDSQTQEGAKDVGESAGGVLQVFEMTAYVALCDTGCTGITSTGYDVRNTIYSPEGLRIVAADPSVLPFGTVIEITSGGNTFQAIVMDSGGAIKGNRLDLLVESEAEARDFGRQGVDVRIIN